MASLAADLGAQVRAVHVHHGLHRQADAWAAFCESVCEECGVALTVLRVDARPPAGESPEDWARRCRYAALETLIEEGEVLLTAHHEQDQAETLLLQLLRGAGPAGLSAMPASTPFGKGWHGRPLLHCSAAMLAAYARAQALKWQDDHSNADRRYDRNFLRHEVLPLLARRWPRYTATLSRAAGWQAEAADLLVGLAQRDLAQVAGDDLTLSLTALQALGAARLRNVLRLWLHRRDLPVPNARHIDQIRLTLISGRCDSVACVRWSGAEVRRYRDRLYAMPPLPPHDATQVLTWNPQAPVPLPGGVLDARRQRGQGISVRLAAERGLTIRFREGGERLCLDDGHHHSVKKLLQERGILPWLRARLPLIYCGGEIAAVADLWLCQAFRAGEDEEGWSPTWRWHEW